jgi:cobalamin biosynthesis Mg chelatase CobN
MVVLHEVYPKRGILRTNVSLLPPDLKEYLLVSACVSLAFCLLTSVRDEMEYQQVTGYSKFQQVTGHSKFQQVTVSASQSSSKSQITASSSKSQFQQVKVPASHRSQQVPASHGSSKTQKVTKGYGRSQQVIESLD